MKITYRGECEELYGREIEVPDHECREHAVWCQMKYVETHGFEYGPFEEWTEEFWKCTICGERLAEPDGEEGRSHDTLYPLSI